MAYTPPLANSLVFDFTVGGYAAPAGSAVNFNFTEADNTIYQQGFDASIFGAATVYNAAQEITVNGFDASSLGSPIIAESQHTYPDGIPPSLAFGSAYVYSVTTSRTLYAAAVAPPAMAAVESVFRNDFQCIPVSAQLAELRAGIFDGGFGSPSLAKTSGAADNQIAYLAGIAMGDIGAPTVENAAKTLAPVGIAPPADSRRLFFLHRMQFASDSGEPGDGPFYIDRFGYVSVVPAEAGPPTFTDASPVGKYVPSGTQPPIQYAPGDVPSEYLQNAIGSETWMQDQFANSEIYEVVGDSSSLLQAAITGGSYGSLFSQRVNPSPVSPSYIGASSLTAEIIEGAAAIVQGAAPDGVRYIATTGIAWTGGVGSPSITTNTLYASGIEAPGFGSAQIGWTQHIGPRSICPYRIYATVKVREVPHYDINSAGGSDMARYGSADISNFIRTLQPISFDASRYGSDSVTHGIRNVAPVGYAAGGIGAPAVDTDHYVGPVSFDATSVGVPAVSDSSQTIVTVGEDTSRFGNERVHLYVRYLYPDSIPEGGSFGSYNDISNRNREVGAIGFSQARVGHPAIEAERYAISLAPSSIIESGYGYPTVSLSSQYVQVDGIESGLVSDYATIYNDERNRIQPSGLFASFLGTPLVRYGQFFIAPMGLDATRFGDAFIAPFLQPAAPPSFDASSFGTARIESQNRTISVASFLPSGMGAPFVADAQRFISPQSIYGTSLGNPTVDTDHHVGPAGFDAASMGMPAVSDNSQTIYHQGLLATTFGEHRVSLYTQPAEPVGIASAFNAGLPRVYNLTQYVRQLFDVTPYDGGVFGNFNYVENRNRTIGAISVPTPAVPAPRVANTGRDLLVQGLDATLFGTAMVADSVRRISPPGIETIGSSSYSVVYNAARVLAPAGTNQLAFGFPSVASNLQTIKDAGGIEGAVGLAYIDYAVRTITQRASFQGDPPPLPRVQLSTREIRPAGIPPAEVGAASLEERFTIFRPSSIIAGRLGAEHRIYNSTPEVRTYGYEQTLFGRPAIYKSFDYYPVQGFVATLFGRTAVEYRTKTLGPAGINAFRQGPNTRVQLADPGLPFPQTIEVGGFRSFNMGLPSARTNVLYPAGVDTSRFGSASVYSNGIFPVGFFAAGTGQDAFGLPRLNATQYIVLDAGQPAQIGESSLGYGIPSGDVATPSKHRVSPHTIWATFDVTEQARLNNGGAWALMDHALHPSNSARPVFGETTVTLKNRRMAASGREHLTMGQPEISNRRRTVAPNGIRAFRYGVPSLNDGGVLDVRGTSHGEFGTPTVEAVEPYSPRYIRPPSVMNVGFASPIVSNYIRYIQPAGITGAFGTPRVHPPEPTLPEGFDASIFGATSISNYTRYIEPLGDEHLRMEESDGFFAGRMRVFKRNTARPASIGPGAAGTPMVSLRVRTIAPTWGDPSSVVSVPSTSKQNRVLLGGYGFMAGEFGDVDRWEAGKIKAHGDDMLLPGYPRMMFAVAPQGFTGEIGQPSVSFRFGAIGTEFFAAGTPAVTHVDNGHVCGSMSRAIPAPGFAAEVFGTPSVVGSP